MIEIREISSPREIRTFITFPIKMYKNNPYYVPSLVSDDMVTFSRKKNPAFKYCDVAFYMAYKEGRPAGRIAAFVNHRYVEKWGNLHGRFGWVDFIEDFEVAEALFKKAETFVREKGMQAIEGPLGFTDLDPEGMLIEGFDELGTLPMIYNHPYYPEYLERMGYGKSTDWLEFEITTPPSIPDKVIRVNKMVQTRTHVRLLNPKNKKGFVPYLNQFFELINVTYDELFGTTTLDQEQINLYIKQYFGFIDPQFTKFLVDEHDKLVAAAVAMPSLSRALQKSRGRIFPFGFAHLLYALKFPKALDFYLVGVKPEYQNRGLISILMNEITQACIDAGIKTAETAGELEDNTAVQGIWKSYEHRQHKRCRCFIKSL